MDFQFDTTADGRTLRLSNVVDEFTRKALAIERRESIDTDRVVANLYRIAAQRGGPPAFVRLDNGRLQFATTEFVCCSTPANPTGTCFPPLLRTRSREPLERHTADIDRNPYSPTSRSLKPA